MAGINIPQRKQNDQLGKLLTVGGLVGGAAAGGPAGAATGAGLGSTVGGLMQSSRSQGPSGVANESDSAMQRRMMANQQDSFQTLRESVTALPQLPDPVRQEYARPIMTAYVAAAKQRGVNPWEGMG